MITWADYPRTGSGSLNSILKYATWKRIPAVYSNPNLMANGADPNDIY